MWINAGLKDLAEMQSREKESYNKDKELRGQKEPPDRARLILERLQDRVYRVREMLDYQLYRVLPKEERNHRSRRFPSIVSNLHRQRE